jgi:hypothetical protein
MSVRRRVATLGVAVGGVLLGHRLTYLMLDPAAHERAALLRRTGHAYLGVANELALIAALTGLAALFIGQLVTSTGGDRDGRLAARIVAFQVSAFVLMEVLERVAAGAPLAELIRTGVLPLGVMTQTGVAILAAVAIRTLLRTADRVAATRGRAAIDRARPVLADALPEPAAVTVSRHLSAAGVRGPPSVL